MSRVHDMGGRYGDGPVDPGHPDDPAIAKEWHSRALAVTVAAGALGQFPIDASRRARESIAPTDYARFSYYEKWMAGLADLLVERGLVTPEELAGTVAPTRSPLADRCLTADRVAEVLAKGAPSARASDVAPIFKVGDAVRTRRPAQNTHVRGGHTRLPGYAAGALGRILRCHGAHVLPDTNAHGLGECPEPLYAVAFDAAELWGQEGRAGDEVIIDLWQSYLGPA